MNDDKFTYICMWFELHNRRVVMNICIHVPSPLLNLHPAPSGQWVDTATFLGCWGLYPEQGTVCTGPLGPLYRR